MASNPSQSYTEALDYLYGFVNWEVERHVRYSPEAMTLERPRRVLTLLGDPHRQYPVIHITGTKGKGSVGAMCASALKSSGLRTGLYSSPHLQDFRERFRINNELIDESKFTSLVNQLKPALEQVEGVTWFEVTTALAFLYFAQAEVDVAVVEVGLGGRLDATTVVTPVVSVITSLSFDHMHLLGDSLESIAREKGGIIKPGVPVVSAPQPEAALSVLHEIARQNESPFTLVGEDWTYQVESSTVDGEIFAAGPRGADRQAYRVALSGEHQALNATVALAALSQARRAGVRLTDRGIKLGLEQVDWPGRLEVVKREPSVVLDAAHNGASSQRLADALTTLFPQRPLALIFGASADKDISGMFDALLPLADFLIAAQAVHPRALAPDEIERLARDAGYTGIVERHAAAADALRRAEALVGSDGLVCTTGSLFIVGEMRAELGLPAGHVASRKSAITTRRSGK